MNSVQTAHTEIRLDKIRVGERKRTLNADKVQGLAESIEQLGLMSPILVTPDYRLIAGYHRLEAFKALGRQTIPAIVQDGDTLTVELAEIDENLIRNELSALEEGEHLIRRNEILEAMGVRTPNHRPEKGADSAYLSTEDIAREVGMSKRTAQERMQIARGLTPEVRDRIRGTELADKKTDLLKLSRLESDAQKEVVEKIVTGESTDVEEAHRQLGPAEKRSRETSVIISPFEYSGRTLYIQTGEPQPQRFNRQTNASIEWALWSWNPVTGCLHDCQTQTGESYCYARYIANRFYATKFVPTFHPERLDAPKHTKVPQAANENIGEKNVFTVSMGDLFGKWVPPEWIEAVLEAVRNAPQWNFLFLTKFPQRLSAFEFPSNAWIGTTVDYQWRVEAAEKAFSKVQAAVKFLSCEPMEEPLRFQSLELFDWVIIGGRSKSTGAPASQPRWQWVFDLMKQADNASCAIYFKTNLTFAPKAYPQKAAHS